MFSGNGFGIGRRQTVAVQTNPRFVLPRFFVIPKFDVLELPLSGEVDNVVSAPRCNPGADGKLLMGAVIEVDHDSVEENRIAADPQLNGTKRSVVPRDVDFAVILTAIDLCAAQEIPILPASEQGGGKDESQEPEPDAPV